MLLTLRVLRKRGSEFGSKFSISFALKQLEVISYLLYDSIELGTGAAGSGQGATEAGGQEGAVRWVISIFC